MTAQSGLSAAVLAAVLFGLAAVLQRVGAARAPSRYRVRSLRGLPWAFVLGVLLDGMGLALSLVAVRQLPVHVVEAVLASSVAAAAVLSAVFLHERLDRTRWAAVGVLTIALVTVAATGGAGEAPTVGGPAAYALTLGLVVVAALLWTSRRYVRRWSPLAIGALSGTSFGMVTLHGRLVGDIGLPLGPTDVVFGATVVGWALLGLLLFWAGLRRGGVTSVVVGQTLGESIVPSLLAVALGERWSDGSPVLTAVAFAIAIGCALLIAAPATMAGGPLASRLDGRRSATVPVRVGS